MKLNYKGKFNGDYDKLPSDELEKHPDAVPFKEETNVDIFMGIMTVVSILLMFGLFAIFHFLAGIQNINLFVVCIWSFFIVIPHELLHAVCYTGEVYMYRASAGAFVACSEPLSKVRYIFMCMLPNIILGFIPYIIFLLYPSSTILGNLGAIGIAIGVGDYYNVFNTLTQVPRGGMCFMHKQCTYWYMPEAK